MRKTFPFSLGFKFSTIIMIMGLAIGALVVLIGSQIYAQSIVNHYVRASKPLTETVLNIVDRDKLDGYYTASTRQSGLDASSELKAGYQVVLEDLQLTAVAGDARYIYFFKPTEQGCAFLFDTDKDPDTLYKFGYIRPWEEGLSDEKDRALAGKSLEVEIADEDIDGWLLTVYTPVADSSDKFVGYLGVDYDAADFVADQKNFVIELALATLFLSALMTAAFLPFLRRLAVRPINEIDRAANTYLESTDQLLSDTNSITDLDIKTRGEIQDLSLSLKQMEAEIKNHVRSLEETTRRAETDSMTGLLNREAFERRVTETLNAVATELDTGEENGAGRRADAIGAGRRVSEIVDGVGGASVGRRASDIAGPHACGTGRRSGEGGAVEANADKKQTYNIFMMIDLDNFKQINDSCGHLAGDRILTACAGVLKRCFRPSDFVARMGGDEFAAFFVSTSYEEAENRAKEIGEKLRNIQVREGITASASIGVAVLPSEKGQTYQTFYIMADDLLYEAKARGRNRYSITKKR